MGKKIIWLFFITFWSTSSRNLFIYRLWRARGEENTPAALQETGEELRASTIELKSPLQLLSQVEQMHKEELDQVLHKLQHENRCHYGYLWKLAI